MEDETLVIPVIRRVLAAATALVAVAASSCEDPGAGTPATSAGTATAARETPASDAFAHFSDVSSESGLTFVHENGFDGRNYRVVETVNGGVAMLDFDDDGWLDVYFANGVAPQGAERTRNALYHNRGDGSFEDVSERSGTAGAACSLGCAAADIDGDGDTDLYVTNDGPNRLYINQGDGRFLDGATAAGVAMPSLDSGAVFFDMDGDGDLDLYVASYVTDTKTDQRPAMIRGAPSYWPPLNYEPTPDHLFENLGDGRFRDVSTTSGIRDAVEPGRGLGVVASDFNGDGKVDLYVANDMSANVMLLGDGKGKFSDEAYFNGTALGDDGSPLGSMGLAVADYDGDGRPDLFVTNYQAQPNNLYRALAGGDAYEEMILTAGVSMSTYPEVSWGTGFVDFNRDGWEDVFVANGHLNPATGSIDETTSYEQVNRVYRNDGHGGLEDVSARCGAALAVAQVSRGAAFGDFDNDGDVDVIVNNSIGPAQVLRNECTSAECGGWLMVKLVGKGMNRDAIGARVTVTAAPLSIWRERASSSSYLSVNDPRLHFGLGAATEVDIEVRWPDGSIERQTGVRANQLVTIRQG